MIQINGTSHTPIKYVQSEPPLLPLADIPAPAIYVRYWGMSGHSLKGIMSGYDPQRTQLIWHATLYRVSACTIGDAPRGIRWQAGAHPRFE